MPQFHGFLDLMASRSFSSIWYWLALVAAWSASGRAVLGVPADVLARAKRAPDQEPGLLMLDWLSLNLPRWRIEPREGLVLLGAAAFALGSLAVLGFVYGLEMAQALVLLALPFLILFGLRLRLARGLAPLLDAAREGRTGAGEAAAEALRRIARHRWIAAVLSIVSVVVTVLWGTRQVLLNNPLAF